MAAENTSVPVVYEDSEGMAAEEEVDEEDDNDKQSCPRMPCQNAWSNTQPPQQTVPVTGLGPISQQPIRFQQRVKRPRPTPELQSTRLSPGGGRVIRIVTSIIERTPDCIKKAVTRFLASKAVTRIFAPKTEKRPMEPTLKMEVDVINKRTLGRMLVEIVGNEGSDDSKGNAFLRRQIQTCISKLENEDTNVWRNAAITFNGISGEVYTIQAGDLRNRFIVFLDANDSITFRKLK